jgi:hypothetical protein
VSASIRVLMLIVAIVTPLPALAFTAGEMLSYCESIRDAKYRGSNVVEFPHTYYAGVCFGGFNAIQRLLDIVYVGERKPALNVCTPKSIDAIQLVRVFDAYARRHPEEQHDHFTAVAVKAIAEVFPCPEGLDLSKKTYAPKAD